MGVILQAIRAVIDILQYAIHQHQPTRTLARVTKWYETKLRRHIPPKKQGLRIGMKRSGHKLTLNNNTEKN